MKRRISLIIITIVFFCSIVLAPIMLIAMPKKEFSENENRKLATMPDFSFSSFAEGEYTKKIESFLIDQFPFRDYFVSLKSKLEIMLGRKEINDIYVCENGYFIDVYKKPKNNIDMIEGVNELASSLKTAKIQLMLVPTAVRVYKEYLPKTAQSYDQMKTIEEIYSSVNAKCIDVSETLFSHKDEKQLFYKLDHHWTTYSAYLAYYEFCRNNGITPLEESEFEIKVATDSFKGTTYSKVNDYSVLGDTIEYYENPDLEVDVYYDDTDEHSSSMYEFSYLEKKDKYSFFLNNLHSLLTIENKNIDSDKELVVVKDSYANCMVPFLANHYKKIYVIDPRNYNDVISDFVNAHEKVTDVFVLYNVSTLDTDVGVKNIF